MKLELGAEPKKVIFLLALVAVGGYVFYDNVWNTPAPGGGGGGAARPAKKTALIPQAEDVLTAPAKGTAPAAAKKGAARGRGGEFRPSLKMEAGVAGVDPTLRLDLLAKVAAVEVRKVERSLFEFAAAPPPKVEDAKSRLPEPKIEVAKRFIGPPEAPPKPPPPPKPKPPAINLKVYGSALPVGAGGVKRVFVMDGDEIFTPAEGDVLKKRYRIVKITPTTVVVEDLDFKNEQTLPVEQIPKTG
jgi:hypothetical protein